MHDRYRDEVLSKFNSLILSVFMSLMVMKSQKYLEIKYRLFISPSVISELDCATTKQTLQKGAYQ